MTAPPDGFFESLRHDLAIAHIDVTVTLAVLGSIDTVRGARRAAMRLADA